MNKSLVKKIDKVFSLYIRKRDCKNGVFVCCSCGQMKLEQQADAGHFINRKWMSTRWREDNVHAQCRSCNRFNEGNASGYALFMIAKYGNKHVEYLSALSRDSALFSDFDGEMMYRDIKNKLDKL